MADTETIEVVREQYETQLREQREQYETQLREQREQYETQLREQKEEHKADIRALFAGRQPSKDAETETELTEDEQIIANLCAKHHVKGV